MRWAALVVGPLCVALSLVGGSASAAGVLVDRAVVRFSAPETGGVRSPRFIFARELAFEARLEALADPDRPPGDTPYLERHLRAALERHVAETLLASLRVVPRPTAEELGEQTRVARAMLLDRVGGRAALEQAAAAEQVDERIILQVLRRTARASLYLDRMVAPMLDPSESELRLVHRSSDLASLPYEDARPRLWRLVVGRRLVRALSAFYQNARPRLSIAILDASGA